MPAILFKSFYTELVEHYFRMAVRFVSVTKSQKWFEFTKAWLEKQSPDDKELLYFVFNRRFNRTMDGVNAYSDRRNSTMKRTLEYSNPYLVFSRLRDLEKEFAIEADLIGEQSNEI